MSDAMGDLLRAEADRLVAGEQVPPFALGRPDAPRQGRRLAPLLAAACVAALVVGVQQVDVNREAAAPAVRPSPAPLTTVVPPRVVRTRLGAPSGHVNGPAVPRADRQAAAAGDGLVLTTAAVSRPSLRRVPAGSGRLVDRCRYTYDQDLTVVVGQCSWSVGPSEGQPEPLTVEQRRVSSRDYLRGVAPEGAAGLLVTGPGREDVLVPLVDPGADWGHRPAYLVLWSRGATDLAALRADGTALARLHVPSDVPVRASDDDPELGTVELPLAARQALDHAQDSRRGLTGQPTVQPVGRADLLVRQSLRPGVTLDVYGVRMSDGSTCTIRDVVDLDGEPSLGGSAGCGPASGTDGAGLYADRSSSAGDGHGTLAQELLSGAAPAGTVRVRLSGEGLAPVEVPAFDGGARWRHRSYYGATWPAPPNTTLTAYDSRGRVLAETVGRGMDPRAFDADVLERVAACVRAHGVTVIEHPQKGAAPAYEYRYDETGVVNGQQITQDCEDQALGR